MDNDSIFLQELARLFNNYAQRDDAIEVISLATADGFPVYSFIKSKHEFELDTMAAAASTLHSVSKAVAHQILSKAFKSTFIEADQGNVCFVAVDLNGKDYVLAMSADQSMNIASLRLLINGLANQIKQPSVQQATH